MSTLSPPTFPNGWLHNPSPPSGSSVSWVTSLSFIQHLTQFMVPREGPAKTNWMKWERHRIQGKELWVRKQENWILLRVLQLIHYVTLSQPLPPLWTFVFPPVQWEGWKKLFLIWSWPPSPSDLEKEWLSPNSKQCGNSQEDRDGVAYPRRPPCFTERQAQSRCPISSPWMNEPVRTPTQSSAENKLGTPHTPQVPERSTSHSLVREDGSIANCSTDPTLQAWE